jgi:multicomponent Na+:H+ antiporter subunit C
VNLFLAVVVAVLFGAGCTLMLKPDLFRIVVGLMLVSNAASLTVIASGLRRGQAAILPFEPDRPVADPLTQAMTLTALIIGFAVTALLLAMAYRVYRTHRSVDLDDLSRTERVAQEALERGIAIERNDAMTPEQGLDPDEPVPVVPVPVGATAVGGTAVGRGADDAGSGPP